MKPELKQRYDKFLSEAKHEAKILFFAGVSTYSIHYFTMTPAKPEDAMADFFSYLDEQLKTEGY